MDRGVTARYRGRMRALAAALLLAVSSLARAAGMSPDPTGLWWVPQESGWGLSLTQQQDIVVAVLFIYDNAQRPAWYVATTTGTFFTDPGHQQVFSGTLYRTSGPWFGGAFDPRAVTATAVGTLSIVYVGKNISLSYTVDGVGVSKSVEQQTFASNVPVLTGGYAGGFAFGSQPPAADCNVLADLFRQPTNFAVSNTVLPGELSMSWGTGTDTFCTIHGPYAQRGRLGRLDGHLSCQPLGFPLSTDMLITLDDIAATENGFNSTAFLRRGGCAYSGRFGGVRLTQ